MDTYFPKTEEGRSCNQIRSMLTHFKMAQMLRNQWHKTKRITRLKLWGRLIRYIEDGRLRIGNNLVENSDRLVGLKNYLFAGSHRQTL